LYSLVLSEHPVKTKASIKHLPGTTIVDLTGCEESLIMKCLSLLEETEQHADGFADVSVEIPL
jgi:hypothetical protein